MDWYMLDFGEPESFDTEAEALAICSDIGFGANESAPPNRYPLRSCDTSDIRKPSHSSLHQDSRRTLRQFDKL